MSALQQPYLTPEEHHALEEVSQVKHEYWNGRRWPLGQPYGATPEAMSGGSHAHARIAANGLGSLYNSLRGKPCTVIGSDECVQIEETSLETYPDLAAFCPEARFIGTKGQRLLDPRVIIEVLSPSTAEYDKGDKFEHYKLIPALTDYLLVSQDRIWVEHYTRQAEGWLRRDYTLRSEVIALPSIEVVLPLDDLYEGLILPSGLLAQGRSIS